MGSKPDSVSFLLSEGSLSRNSRVAYLFQMLPKLNIASTAKRGTNKFQSAMALSSVDWRYEEISLGQE